MQNRVWRDVLRAVLVAAVALLGIGNREAQAHRRDFPFTYDWTQASKGEKEIELHSRYRKEDRSFEQQIEFEYGITDRFMVAPYIVYEREAGERLKYHEFKFEARYQLGKFKTNTWLPGLYGEYAKEKDEDPELEGKLILSRYNKHGENVSVNLITEKQLNGAARWEHEFSLGYARDLGKSRYGMRGGGEVIRYDDGKINAGPVFGFGPTANTWIVAGIGFPVNSINGNKVEARLIAELEF